MDTNVATTEIYAGSAHAGMTFLPHGVRRTHLRKNPTCIFFQTLEKYPHIGRIPMFWFRRNGGFPDNTSNGVGNTGSDSAIVEEGIHTVKLQTPNRVTNSACLFHVDLGAKGFYVLFIAQRTVSDSQRTISLYYMGRSLRSYRTLLQ